MTTGAFARLAAGLELAVTAVVAVVAAVASAHDFVLGVVVGAFLGAINLLALGWLCGRLLGGSGARWPYGVLLGGKLVILIALVYGAIRFASMDPIALVTGLSLSALGIVMAAGWIAVRKLELTT